MPVSPARRWRVPRASTAPTTHGSRRGRRVPPLRCSWRPGRSSAPTLVSVTSRAPGRGSAIASRHRSSRRCSASSMRAGWRNPRCLSCDRCAGDRPRPPPRWRGRRLRGAVGVASPRAGPSLVGREGGCARCVRRAFDVPAARRTVHDPHPGDRPPLRRHPSSREPRTGSRRLHGTVDPGARMARPRGPVGAAGARARGDPGLAATWRPGWQMTAGRQGDQPVAKRAP